MRGARVVFGWAWKHLGERWLRSRFGDKPDASRVNFLDIFVLANCGILCLWAVLSPGAVPASRLCIALPLDSTGSVRPSSVVLSLVIAALTALLFWNLVLRFPQPWNVWAVQLLGESKQDVVEKTSASCAPD